MGQLINEHLSIERALVQVRMPRMSPTELNEIVEERSITGPSATFDRPMPGSYCARVRVAGPPDAATDYGAVRTFDVPMPLWAKVLVSALLVSPFL